MIRMLLVDVLDDRGEVSAPDLRDAFERLCGRRFDRTERLRVMQVIRSILLERAAAGELRLKEVRRTTAESRGPTGLLRNYYERARAPGRAGVGKSRKQHEWNCDLVPRCQNCGMLKTWPGAKHGCSSFKDTRAKRREVRDDRRRDPVE